MRHLLAVFLILSVSLSLVTQIALSSPDPEEALGDPALEARARMISQQLRCVVCKSQSINDSNAPLAKDLRLLVRERVAAGDSDAQVLSYVTDRYGEYVLLNPRKDGINVILWSAPLIVLLLGGGLAFYFIRRQERQIEAPPVPLTDAEKALLDKVLEADNPASVQKEASLSVELKNDVPTSKK